MFYSDPFLKVTFCKLQGKIKTTAQLKGVNLQLQKNNEPNQRCCWWVVPFLDCVGVVSIVFETLSKVSAC